MLMTAQQMATKARPEEEAEEEEALPFADIEKLQELGIAQQDIAKVKGAGIYTLGGMVMVTKKTLCSIKGLSEAKVDKMLEAVAKTQFTGFLTGAEMLEKRVHIVRVTTGSKALDDLLGGGIETQAITEAFGEFRTGKTQISHTLCVTSQLPRKMGGGNGKVVYIDTEGTFRPERIKPIAERFGLDPTAALENILVARAYTHEHQMNLLNAVTAKMADDQFRLLIMDSVTALFRVDFQGRGELAERQQKLGQMLNKLIKVAEEFNVAVFLTNQVVSDPGGAAMFVADPKKPIGGHILAHASTTRLFLRKGRGEQRICKIYDSPCLPESEAVFAISEQGIIDAKD
jgi:meiotic recombination protein DMC1